MSNSRYVLLSPEASLGFTYSYQKMAYQYSYSSNQDSFYLERLDYELDIILYEAYQHSSGLPYISLMLAF